ncbi:DEAD/DEAH box helicase [Billgrantia montanilacus]|uniref:Helicase n=1 Tax=Billgrantia montanilacus TaxID=2282305 RepID=A0A368TRH8_9GAMM|nr:DEAD/DEAH box helicase [Halomonas montanilacus]RCV86837.1 helicase [Halomonas montanilacus]
MELSLLIEKLKDSSVIERESFSIAKSLANIYNNSDSQSISKAQEYILRAMDKYEYFGDSKVVIDSLARELGLFPYLKMESLNIRDMLAAEAHRISIGKEDIYFHGPQAEVYYKIIGGQSVVLSAPTSFGKSLIIDALIASERFSNIVIVVPTISLIDETRRRLSKFSPEFKIVTHSLQSKGEKNIFVLTQERVLEEDFIDKVDFFVIDEFYKLSPWADGGNRCSLLNEAFYRLYKKCSHFYMLGPNIQGVAGDFIENVRFEFIKFSFSTVVTEFHDLTSTEKEDVLSELCESIDGQTIVFCSSPARANSAAELMASNIHFEGEEEALNLADWISENYHADWVLTNALRCGVGIHHARIPRSVSQYIVDLFNTGKIKFLVCTSTLIEGVNTATKNIVCYDNKINRTNINFFTFNNIAGRSGRMFKHFIGNVYLLAAPPTEQLPFVDIPIYSQGADAPESLLVNMDEKDLTQQSRDRIKSITEQNYLDLKTIRGNKTVEPALQIDFAILLDKNYEVWINQLLWKGYPSYDQLKFMCSLIWDIFDGARVGNRSVFSASQLAFKISELSMRKPISQLIEEALAYKPDEKVDIIISRILDFRRLWANFHFPRLLRAIESIVNSVQRARGANKFCDYSAYSIMVENYFFDPSLVALEEYGLPIEVSSKFESALSHEGDLDKALIALKNIGDSYGLSEVDRRFVIRAQVGI